MSEYVIYLSKSILSTSLQLLTRASVYIQKNPTLFMVSSSNLPIKERIHLPAGPQ